MSIQDIGKKINAIITDDTWFSIMLVIFASTAAFGLGRASVHTPAMSPQAGVVQTASTHPPVSLSVPSVSSSTALGTYVASKNSTKYHLPWCSGAQRIAEANKVWFASKAEAEAAGYTPAANCEGI